MPAQKKCEKCGETFGCSMRDPGEKCWCVTMPKLLPIPKKYRDCLCPNCLAGYVAPTKPFDSTQALQEHEDFYYEDGKMVFTERYHLKRGYCCGNNCRHCPYGDDIDQ